MKPATITLFSSVCMAASLLTACAKPAQPQPADNAYTAESTYKKLASTYPYIHIASKQLPATVRVLRNISYVSNQGQALQLDVFMPAHSSSSSPPLPGIVLVHGGGWRSGTRDNLAPMAIRLAECGYVAATISYRLSDEARYPAAIHDVKAAIRWLRTHAVEYQLDPTHIAVAGGSAGGQIAALVGVTNDRPEFDPQAQHSAASSAVSSAVQAIINIDGLSDFTSEEARKYEDDPRKQPSAAGAWFGGTYAEKTEVWKAASPLTHVSKNTPPILFIGSAQRRYSLGRDEMMEKLNALGIANQTVLLPDTPHSFWLFDPWLGTTVEAMAVFLAGVFEKP
ncbi:alpha/beta hydrolase fold domain-containing protein [Undibacterium sp. Tian12W]|uniref:alpha/beta hydrolase fold domain-containing protein n=1 Tax=Undibacterium sp. Tian12W TaxID=3413054 RepID=UPI003BF30A78